MSDWFGLRFLFGAPKPKKAASKPGQKTARAPSARAALLQEAMVAHRAGRAHMRDALERKLDEYRAKIPRPGHDAEAAEWMRGQPADGAVKRLMTHDLKRFLTLVGIRQMLGESAPVPKSTRSSTKL